MSSLFHPEVVIVHDLLSGTTDAALDHDADVVILYLRGPAETSLLGRALP